MGGEGAGMMGVNERRDRNGKKRIWVDKRWPDGTQLQRIVPNKTTGKALLSRINESIAMGTWRELKKELALKGVDRSVTVQEFSESYLRHCEAINHRPDFKRQAVSVINRILGDVEVASITRAHANEFIRVRSREVSSSTINRGIAVLKHMMGYAVEQGVIKANPLAGFKAIKTAERSLRILTLEQERNLVACAYKINKALGSLVGILGETGMRRNEALYLTWDRVHLADRYIVIERTKNTRIRHVRLSPFAVSCFNRLPRFVGVNWVFIKPDGKRWKDPREAFEKARKLAGVPWVRMHDLRHFRATQWVKQGVDIRTVQELLGHRSITTTMRYSHYSQSHAQASVDKVFEDEQRQIEIEEAK